MEFLIWKFFGLFLDRLYFHLVFGPIPKREALNHLAQEYKGYSGRVVFAIFTSFSLLNIVTNRVLYQVIQKRMRTL